ncbi:alkaline phosphatase D family protein [Roseimaritima sediminicola]|uniref:alkaline phosphatase D family protein n=1 Tax=Roseimaritima sediminicola TaxID=2662066 RepID=UPI0012983C53|nr:alkaline phosphatase D family protein [Roseimaritima sediminicola]
MRTVVLLLCTIVLVSPAVAQKPPEYDLGGASKPRPDMSFRQDDQYKRVHQTALRYLLRGELDKPQEFLQQYLADHSDDVETMYMLGMVRAARGEIAEAEQHLTQAIQAGLPAGRILAGPRSLTEPLQSTRLLRRLHAAYQNRPVHGPLLGNVTDGAASFWFRTSDESAIEVIVREADSDREVARSQPVRSHASDDYTAVARVTGLQPDTAYRYAVAIDGKSPFQQETYRFRTMPQQGHSAKFVLAFGGGAGYVPENERMWTTIAGCDPQALLLLGDNVYIDDPESRVMQQYTYQRRQSRPQWRDLTAQTAVFTIWDDHDFSTNDSWGGPAIDVPFWKKDIVFPVFRQNWANPGYGGGDEQPGCWYAFQIADVDFLMLDCRYYRTDPRKQPRSMLGPVQKQWLKQQLLDAKGTFKVICSSVPWDFRTKGDSRDTWNGYKKEHEEILSFIADNEIEGVVLMSADRHRSDAWKLSRPDGYDLYEFNSSRLTNQHVHPTMEKQGALFSFNKPQSFGLVTFDTTAEDPQVTYEVVDINGNRPHAITVHRSELE